MTASNRRPYNRKLSAENEKLRIVLDTLLDRMNVLEDALNRNDNCDLQNAAIRLRECVLEAHALKHFSSNADVETWVGVFGEGKGKEVSDGPHLRAVLCKWDKKKHHVEQDAGRMSYDFHPSMRELLDLAKTVVKDDERWYLAPCFVSHVRGIS